jgi:murein L,D-transpeptidase YafK
VLPEAAPEALTAPRPCEEIVQLEIHKEERTLTAVCEGGASRSFVVALGREPVGPKRYSGDRKTPEGTYRVAEAPRPSPYHLFIPLDYPSRGDAESALAAGVISRAEYTRILAALDAGDLPPQDTALGGSIGIHGEGERWEGDSPYFDWTNGCIALSDADVEFLAARVKAGTPVLILP